MITVLGIALVSLSADVHMRLGASNSGTRGGTAEDAVASAQAMPTLTAEQLLTSHLRWELRYAPLWTTTLAADSRQTRLLHRLDTEFLWTPSPRFNIQAMGGGVRGSVRRVDLLAPETLGEPTSLNLGAGESIDTETAAGRMNIRWLMGPSVEFTAAGELSQSNVSSAGASVQETFSAGSGFALTYSASATNQVGAEVRVLNRFPEDETASSTGTALALWEHRLTGGGDFRAGVGATLLRFGIDPRRPTVEPRASEWSGTGLAALTSRFFLWKPTTVRLSSRYGVFFDPLVGGAQERVDLSAQVSLAINGPTALVFSGNSAMAPQPTETSNGAQHRLGVSWAYTPQHAVGVLVSGTVDLRQDRDGNRAPAFYALTVAAVAGGKYQL